MKEAEDLLIKYPLDAVTQVKFAELFGKSTNAVEIMVKREKLPTVDYADPEKPNARLERLVNIDAFNKGIQEAYNNKPKEYRDAWLMWLGL